MKELEYAVPIHPSYVNISDSFFTRLMEIVRQKMIPYQWDALNDQVENAAPSHCMENFRIAAGLSEGDFHGWVFQDSDFAKWIEAVGYSLMWHKDSELEKIADEAIDIVVKAQQPDGYLNTYYIINGLDKRWTDLREHHELYSAGHMIEGAIAYYQATGKDKLLKAMIKYVDHIDETFGTEPGKKRGYPGHEEIELALVKLYQITKDDKHLKLAKYFIDERGRDPLYFIDEEKGHGRPMNWRDSYFQYQYYQAGAPVREQETADGHAVRAVYLYSGMADVARETNDDGLFKACKRMWNNIVKKRMYITGAIGSSAYGEAFTYDYDLPNDTAYAETCAAIGLVFFAQRMFQIEQRGEYGDVMERAIYNGIISGMSLDGTEYFYVNPLEVVPEACEKDQLRRHVKVERQKWFGCACCPPNLARLLSSLGGYIYMVKENRLLMNLYIGGELQTTVDDVNVKLKVESNYPWEGNVKIRMDLSANKDFVYSLRVPSWCRNYSITVNGEQVKAEIKDGFANISRQWSSGDIIELDFEMKVEMVRSHPEVRQNVGRVAVVRGPIVYCLEEADNGKGLHNLYIYNTPDFKTEFEKDSLGGVITILSNGKKMETNLDEDTLYYYEGDWETVLHNKTLKWIPYYAWANRGIGEMTVWVKKI